MKTKILLTTILFLMFFGIYNATSKPGENKFGKDIPSATTSPISSQTARSWVYNYAQSPLNQIAYQSPGDTTVYKIKSWEMDSSLIDTIRAHSEIRGLRCYFAKRSSDVSKKDYTVIIVPYNSSYANIISGDSLKWAFDWHKPGPPSTNASADTLGGPIH